MGIDCASAEFEKPSKSTGRLSPSVGGESRGEGIFPPCGEREGGGFPLDTCLEARVLVGEEYHVWLFSSTVQGRHDN